MKSSLLAVQRLTSGCPRKRTYPVPAGRSATGQQQSCNSCCSGM